MPGAAAAGERTILAVSFDLASPAALTTAAALAERAGLDLIVTGYPEPGSRLPAPRIDPLSAAAFLISGTRRIGLAALAPSAGWAPFHAARAFSALDWLSRGRAGWFAAPGEDLAADPGRERFREHLDVVFALFDSWDEDALAFDKAAAVFADRDKVRRIAHAGRHFTVDGPLNSPRPPQGRPVMLQALEPEAPAAVDEADLVIVRAASPADAAAQRAGSMQSREARVLADLVFALTPGPLPPARRDAPALTYAGPAEGLVELMASWLRQGACDGFNLLPADPLRDLAVFADAVAPALLAWGVTAAAATGGDLRARLGLRRPSNRFHRPEAARLDA